MRSRLASRGYPTPPPSKEYLEARKVINRFLDVMKDEEVISLASRLSLRAELAINSELGNGVENV